MYMKYEHKMCAHSVWFRKKLWHTHTHTLWPKKEMLKKNCYSLYWYIHLRTRFGSVVWGWLLWRKIRFLHHVILLSVAGPIHKLTLNTSSYTLSLAQKRFRSRRGNLNTEFHIFLGNVCPVHFGMCIHDLLLLIGAKLCNKTQLS